MEFGNTLLIRGLSTPETEKVGMDRNIFKNKISLSLLVLHICFQKYLFKRHNGKIKLFFENIQSRKKDLYSSKVYVRKGANGGRRQLTGQEQWL
jgi:hypothetical protein